MGNGFVSKIDPHGTSLVYSALTGGAATSIAVDANGNAYIAGWEGKDYPTTPGAFQEERSLSQHHNHSSQARRNHCSMGDRLRADKSIRTRGLSFAFAADTLPIINVSAMPARVFGAALAPGFSGLYQIAIETPASLGDGDWPIQATIGGVQSETGIVLTVQH